MSTSIETVPWRVARQMRAPRRLAQGSFEGANARFTRQTIALFLIHAGLGFAIRASSLIATAHALATVALVFLAAAKTKSPLRLIPMLAYAAASESLWRLGEAAVFYELAKYLLAAVSILGVLRFGRSNQGSNIPLVYFLLLVPSILVMPSINRDEISFNLSGPLSLAMTTFFFGHRAISPGTLRKILVAMMGPIVSFVFIATFSTLTTEDIDFWSSKVASAGLGPNQASSLLGMGGLIAFLYLSVLRRQPVLSWTFAALGVWCSGQAALTFSRGGVATAAGAVAAASFFLILDRRFRGVVVLRVVLVVILASLFVVPLLDNFTGGDLTKRFSSTHLTGRDKIIKADVIAFEEHPVLGVGPGQSKPYHALTFRRASTHTEYSRLLAEHGLLGIISLLLLVKMGFSWLWQPVSLRSKALSAALITWSLLYMFHAAMRMAIVSFAFALASTILVEPPLGPPRRSRAVRGSGPTAARRTADPTS